MAIAPQEIGEAFRKLGIGVGDGVMLHSDALVLAQLPPLPPAERYGILFHQIGQVLGANGTLVLPSFTYSATKGEVFDPATTPSTVGVLTEYFRTLPDVLRSSNPIFSVAARGRLAQEFAASATGDCFGAGSAFDRLARENFWIVCLGCSLTAMTFVHYVEQSRGVPYRYMKTFDGQILENGTIAAAPTRYYVRDVTRETSADLTRLAAQMRRSGSLKTESIGRVSVSAVRAQDFIAEANALLDTDINGLIVEGKNG